jgi:hypothetical protein
VTAASLPLPQPSKPQQLQQPQPDVKPRQPLANPHAHAPKLPHLQLEDLEDDVSEGNGVAARMNVLSDDDDDDFDVVHRLPDPADAKHKQPQRLAGSRKKNRKYIV